MVLAVPARVEGAAEDGAVGQPDALGLTGGAGGEHHAGGEVRRDVPPRRNVGAGREGLLVRQTVQQEGGAGPFAQGTLPLGRQAGVEGDAEGAQFGQGQVADGDLDRAVQRDGDRGTDVDLVGQVVGELVGAGLQRAVGEGAGAVGEGGAVRVGGGPRLEDLGEMGRVLPHR